MSIQYRYTLQREAAGRIPWVTKPRVVFVMLNPSTADDHVDDPTIRRCIGFARSWGYRELRVVNLFAARATNPRDLRAMTDPVGPLNDETLVREMSDAPLPEVVAAWGTNGGLHGRDRAVLDLLPHVDWMCLGVTKAGHPRHPLYLRQDTKLVPFTRANPEDDR